eukprot:1169059-Rhodomonas_salina.2
MSTPPTASFWPGRICPEIRRTGHATSIPGVAHKRRAVAVPVPASRGRWSAPSHVPRWQTIAAA